MSTFGISTSIVMSTDKVRTNLTSFYKALITDNPKMYPKYTINAGDTLKIDLSSSNFIVVISDKYGLDQDALSIKFTDSDITPKSFTLENVGFLMLNYSNLVLAEITNTLTDYSVDVFLVY